MAGIPKKADSVGEIKPLAASQVAAAAKAGAAGLNKESLENDLEIQAEEMSQSVPPPSNGSDDDTDESSDGPSGPPPPPSNDPSGNESNNDPDNPPDTPPIITTTITWDEPTSSIWVGDPSDGSSMTVDSPSFETGDFLTPISMSTGVPEVIGSFDFIPLYNADGEPMAALEYFLMQLQSQICAQNIITSYMLPIKIATDSDDTLEMNYSSVGLLSNDSMIKLGRSYAAATQQGKNVVRAQILFFQIMSGIRDALDIGGTSRYWRDYGAGPDGSDDYSLLYSAPHKKLQRMWQMINRSSPVSYEGSDVIRFTETSRGTTNSLTDLWTYLGFSEESYSHLSNTALWTNIADYVSFCSIYGSDSLLVGPWNTPPDSGTGRGFGMRSDTWTSPGELFKTYNFRRDLEKMPAFQLRQILNSLTDQVIGQFRAGVGWAIPTGGSSTSHTGATKAYTPSGHWTPIWELLSDFDPTEFFTVCFYVYLTENIIGSKTSSRLSSFKNDAQTVNPSTTTLAGKKVFFGSSDDTDFSGVDLTAGGSILEQYNRAVLGEFDQTSVWDHDLNSLAGFSKLNDDTGDTDPTLLIFENNLTLPTDLGIDVKTGFDYFTEQFLAMLNDWAEGVDISTEAATHSIWSEFMPRLNDLRSHVPGYWEGLFTEGSTTADIGWDTSVKGMADPTGMAVGSPLIQMCTYLKILCQAFKQLPSASESHAIGRSHESGTGTGDGSFDWGNHMTFSSKDTSGDETDFAYMESLPSGNRELQTDHKSLFSDYMGGAFELALLGLAHRDIDVMNALIDYLIVMSKMIRYEIGDASSYPVTSATTDKVNYDEVESGYGHSWFVEDPDTGEKTLKISTADHGVYYAYNKDDPCNAALKLSAAIIKSLNPGGDYSGFKTGHAIAEFETPASPDDATFYSAVLNNEVLLSHVTVESGGSMTAGVRLTEDGEPIGEDPAGIELTADTTMSPKDKLLTDLFGDTTGWWTDDTGEDGDSEGPTGGSSATHHSTFDAGWWPLLNPVYNYLITCLNPATFNHYIATDGSTMASMTTPHNLMEQMLYAVDWLNLKHAYGNIGGGQGQFSYFIDTGGGADVPGADTGHVMGRPSRFMRLNSQGALDQAVDGNFTGTHDNPGIDAFFPVSRVSGVCHESWIALGVMMLVKQLELVMPYGGYPGGDASDYSTNTCWVEFCLGDGSDKESTANIMPYEIMYGEMLAVMKDVAFGYDTGGGGATLYDPRFAAMYLADTGLGMTFGDAFMLESPYYTPFTPASYIPDGPDDASDLNLVAGWGWIAAAYDDYRGGGGDIALDFKNQMHSNTYLYAYLDYGSGTEELDNAITAFNRIVRKAMSADHTHPDFDEDVSIPDVDPAGPEVGVRTSRKGLRYALEDILKVNKGMSYLMGILQDVHSATADIAYLIGNIQTSDRANIVNSLRTAVLDSPDPTLPAPINGATSRENILSSTHMLEKFFWQTRAWNESEEDADTARADLVTSIKGMKFFPASDLMLPQYFTQMLSILKSDMGGIDTSDSKILTTPYETRKSANSFRASDLSTEISTDQSKRIISVGLPLGFMEKLRSQAEKATGEHIGNDSLIRINIWKTDLRLDGITFTPKSFLFDTSIFSEETTPLDAGGELDDSTSYYFRTDKTSKDCFGLGPYGIIQADATEHRLDLNDLVTFTAESGGDFRIVSYNITTKNYLYFTEGPDTSTYLPNIGVTRRRYSLDEFLSEAPGELGLSLLSESEMSALFYNHIVSRTLQNYLQLSLGVDVSESGFYFNQSQVGFDDVRGSIRFDRESFRDSEGEAFYSESEFDGTEGPYTEDPNVIETIYNNFVNYAGPEGTGFRGFISQGDSIPVPIVDRVTNTLKNTTLFGHETYYRRLTLPRVFERTFTMLIDIENDFEVMSTAGAFDIGEGDAGGSGASVGFESGPDTLSKRGSEMYAFHATIDLLKTETRSIRTSDSAVDLITES